MISDSEFHSTFVVLSNTKKRLRCSKKYPDLLTLLEAHNIEVEYQCRQGFCGSCRLTLLNGEVKYQFTPIACIANDEILPCCCLPVNEVEIEL